MLTDHVLKAQHISCSGQGSARLHYILSRGRDHNTVSFNQAVSMSANPRNCDKEEYFAHTAVHISGLVDC